MSACREAGISCIVFYYWKEQSSLFGADGLLSAPPRPSGQGIKRRNPQI